MSSQPRFPWSGSLVRGFPGAVVAVELHCS